MRQSLRRLTWLGWSFVLVLPGPALAQNAINTVEHLDSDRPEAWAMNYFASISLLAGLGTPRTREPGSLEGGIEVDWIPHLSRAERRVGFNGVKEEDLNQAPIIFRPLLTLGLPGGFSVTAAYVPPLRVFGVKPNLVAAALERPLYERPPWTFGVRVYGQVGTIEGAFTCSSEMARFPPGSPQNAFGCEKASSDTVTLRYVGVELSGSYRIARARGLTPYLAVAGNYLDTTFQVDGLTFGVQDRTRLEASTWTFSTSAGVVYPLTERLSLNISLFYSPLWVTRPPATSSQNDGLFNARAMVIYRFR